MAIAIEIPTGTINGTNTLFTAEHEIVDPVISVNGLIYSPQDTYYGFTFTGSIFTMGNAPIEEDVVLILYQE